MKDQDIKVKTKQLNEEDYERKDKILSFGACVLFSIMLLLSAIQ
tara:strand:+ start:5989 stop:6120 length:132 start_codon:yes stop_codon:yes gene_type:complete